MSKYNVTDAGNDFLQKTGLLHMIDEKWREINEKLLYSSPSGDDMLKDALEDKTIRGSRKREIEKLFKSSKHLYPEDIIVATGEITDTLFDNNSKEVSRKYGLETISQLDGIITSYCLAKYKNELSGPGRKKYLWRSNGYETSVYGDTHGDLQISQTVTKPKVNKNTIDGSEIVQLYGDLPSYHINVDYSYWLPLIATTLKFADTVDTEIEQASFWRNMLKDFGWDGEITQPGLNAVGHESFICDYAEDVMAREPDHLDVNKTKKLFFGAMAPNANHEYHWLPIIDKDENLVFCSNKGKDIDIKTSIYGGDKYSKGITVPKEDIWQLFVGGVSGIMSNQSRTRPSYLAFMLWEHELLRKGMTPEEIRGMLS